MRKLNSKELRNEWIKFYEERGHKNIGAVSLVGDGTTGVLFNVAGMQPLMPYLLGKAHPEGKRLCNVQGCVRTNDIESVGDKSHATFFEMMGSWSLGDYFKEERCKWSYDLFTKVLEIPRERLATTCFEGDKNAPKDEEAAIIKEKVGFKKENIYFLPKSENWWEIESGPCGPDSEYFYITDIPACSKKCNPSCDCGHFIEIGNDVFMQYEKVDKDKYIPLKNKNVDTGWGFERILAFLNTDDGDIYKTDLYAGSMNIIEEKLGVKYGDNEDIDRSIRIILDHTRTSTMLLGDEKHLVPSNVGAGYILRRLIRRAIRHIKKLNLDPSIMVSISKYFIENIYDESYPNLLNSEEFILNEITKETNNFLKTLSKGLKELEKMIEKSNFDKKRKLDSSLCFKLYDTYGFPFELTYEILKEKNIDASKEEFDTYMEKQKNLARQNVKKIDELKVLGDIANFKEESKFVYDTLETNSKVIFVADENGNEGEIYSGGIVILDETPFYATMGGQLGDTGYLTSADGLKAEVLKTEKTPNKQNALYIRLISGSINKGDLVTATVDKEKRFTTCQNHTATHLLQRALKDILGEEVNQKGSYVDNETLRFDFNYSDKITDDKVIEVENKVNEYINACYPAIIKEMSIEEAKEMGAMALFGEKYGDKVRVVKFGPSIELCGGTHVSNTGNIRKFAIKSIESKGLNIYRIEAVCDTNLKTEIFTIIKPYNDEMIKLLAKAKKLVKDALEKGIKLELNINISNEAPLCYKDILENKKEVETLRKQIADLEKKYDEEQGKLLLSKNDEYLVKKKEGRYGDVLILEFEGENVNALKQLTSNLITKLNNGICFIINKNNNSLNFIARSSDNIADKINIGALIKDVSLLAEGNGGGSKTFAQGGGSSLENLDVIKKYLKDNIIEKE
ncbi:MAG: alanine--tRNA ligase [Tenericutes bacterium]|nr:alanine--tRNA ligase [Mycoplasmatota bacterium]